MPAIILTNQERDDILSTLTNEQRVFLDNYVKRGKKTKFANVMAMRTQGQFFDENLTEQEMESLIEGWLLVDIKDAGENWQETKELRCECGRILRYQYIVKHTVSQEIRMFGIDHFEEHTQITESIIREIKKGFKEIDYELDELLSKVRDNWKLSLSIPEEIMIPSEIESQLSLELPLLDRQEGKLKSLILDYFEERERNRIIESKVKKESNTYPPETDSFLEETGFDDNEPFMGSLFDSPDKDEIEVEIELTLSTRQKEKVLTLLEGGIQSIRVICETLIKNGYAGNERYSTGKPRIYPIVCFYIDSLVRKNKAKYVLKGMNDCRVQVIE